MTDTTRTESAIGKIREQLEIIAEEHRVALCKQAEDTCDTLNTDQTRADVEALVKLYAAITAEGRNFDQGGSLIRAIAALQRQEEMAKEIERLKWAEAEAMALVLSHEGHIERLKLLHNPLCDALENDPSGITKPCNCRVTLHEENARLKAELAQAKQGEEGEDEYRGQDDLAMNTMLDQSIQSSTQPISWEPFKGPFEYDKDCYQIVDSEGNVCADLYRLGKSKMKTLHHRGHQLAALMNAAAGEKDTNG